MSEAERETEVLQAELVSGDDGSKWWGCVTAETIAEHVEDGWTVEAVQWGRKPGEAWCVVLSRKVSP